MRPEGFVPANFTISEEACQYIRLLKADIEKQAKELMAATSVAWGHFIMNDGRTGGNVLIGFYDEATMTDALRQAVQTVSGVDIVFFITPKDTHHFEGMEIHSTDNQFHLRAQNI